VSEIDGLIERLRKATGEDWELDRLIFEAVHLPTEFCGSIVKSWSRRGGGHGYTLNTADGFRHLNAVNAPNYTASIDAALTLVPEDALWRVGHEGDDAPGIYLAVVMPRGPQTHSEHSSPAIAICIAALEARKMVGAAGIEPATPCVSSKCSPTELRALSETSK
jgi:hypothetical protein